MGQTASTIEAENPRPAEFTYDQALRGNVDIDSDGSSDESSCDGSDSERGDNRRTSRSPRSTKRNGPKPELKQSPTPMTSQSPVPEQNTKSTDSMMKMKLAKSLEDEIDDEQARLDLLAYAGIVGEHAANLPLTWRDDPQLAHTVTTLSSHEYAVKADAFIPCHIRIIGASSSLYDRNADIPVREEINLSESAVEPGLSSGGVVCNTLLKALYDFQNGGLMDVISETIDEKAIEDNLFSDDNDDFDFGQDPSFGEDFEFDQTVNGAALTWSGLLRRMKDEMENQDRDMVPILTTSKKFDLEESVNLLPQNFDPKQNMKFSLFVGCNYEGKDGELKSSHNDIKTMKDYITNVHGFPEHDDYMTILLDDKVHKKPTHGNIMKALQQIALRSRPGDAVFIQFVGHGGRIQDVRAQTDVFDEVFVPCDFQRRGLITEKTLIRSFIARMAEDVTVTMLLDSCDSGIVFDMPYSWETRHDYPESPAKLSPNPNFSFMRALSVVDQMRVVSSVDEPGESYDSYDEDEDDFDARKESRLLKELGGLGDKLFDVAEDVKGVALDMAIKGTDIVKKEIRHLVESDDEYEERYSSRAKSKSKSRSYEVVYDDYDDYDDDARSDRSYDRYEDEPRSGSFDDYVYETDSYDSYEDQIRRRR